MDKLVEGVVIVAIVCLIIFLSTYGITWVLKQLFGLNDEESKQKS